jgi:hypothetical protein
MASDGDGAEVKVNASSDMASLSTFQVVLKLGFRADENIRQSLDGMLGPFVVAGRKKQFEIPLWVWRVFDEYNYKPAEKKWRLARCDNADCKKQRPKSGSPQCECGQRVHKTCLPSDQQGSPFKCKACSSIAAAAMGVTGGAASTVASVSNKETQEANS